MFGTAKKSAPGVALFVIGAAAGAVAALLLAPMTGRKMQRKVMQVTDKMVDKVEDFGHTVRKAVNV
jgi:gas vesicle protein